MLQIIHPDPTIDTSFASGTIAVPVVVTTKQTARQSVPILHLINGEHFSGAERVQQLLGQRLGEAGYDAHFACLKPGKFEKLSGLPLDRVHAVAMQSRLDTTVVSRVCSLIEQHGIQLLHAHTPRTAMVAAQVAKRTKLPWVYHVHSPTVRDSNRRVVNWLNGIVEKRSLKNCDALITVSQSLRDEMLGRGVPADKIYVVPNGVACQVPIRPTERLQNSKWRLGVVALFRPRKGLEILLEAFETLCEMPNVDPSMFELEIIGGFETEAYEESIRAQIDSMEHREQVQLRGFVTDVPQRMRALDLLVLPSVFGEGMPMVVLEALACGVPVVATRVEGTPEVITDGQEGWLAEPGDIEDLAQTLRRATRSRPLWCQASTAAARRQQDKFSDVAMSAAVADVYQQFALPAIATN